MIDKDLMLNEEDYKALGLSAEQIELFENANAIAESVDMLPDDPNEMIGVIERNMPNGFEAGMRYLDELAQNNPEALAKLITMTALVTNAEYEPETSVDPVLAKLSQPDLDKAEREFYEMINELSPARKKEFFELLNNITVEQKQELVDKLLQR